MRLIVYAALTSAAFLLPDRGARAADPDQAALQGKWNVESYEYNGTPVEMMKEGTREIKDDKYTLTPKSGEPINGVIKLDSAKKPKQIDLEVNGRTLKGIYEIDGESLKLAYTLNGDERPTELASKPDTGIVLVIHKRAK